MASAKIPIESVTAETLQLTEVFLSVLRKKAETLHAGNTTQQLQSYSGLLTKTMRAAASMIKEARALMKDTKDALEALGFEEQAKLILEVVDGWPADVKKTLKDAL